MKRIIRFVIPACFASLLSFQVLAEAPVVDDSENLRSLKSNNRRPESRLLPVTQKTQVMTTLNPLWQEKPQTQQAMRVTLI